MGLLSVSFTVKRSITIDQPASEVFSKLLYFEEMNKWSPWLITETNAQTQLRGTDGQVGTISTWEGEITGKGEMEIIEVDSPRHIHNEVRFLAPWQSTAQAYFDVADNGQSCTVTWTLESSLPIFMFWMKNMMIAWIGMDYERGLRMLKEYTETGEIASKVDILDQESGEPFHYIGIKNACTLDEIGEAMPKDFNRLAQAWQTLGITEPQFAATLYHKMDIKTQRCVYTALLPVPGPVSTPPAGTLTGHLAGGNALVVKHTGSYNNLGNAWSAGMTYVRYKKLKARKSAEPLEVYVSNPNEVEAKDLETRIYFPVKA